MPLRVYDCPCRSDTMGASCHRGSEDKILGRVHDPRTPKHTPKDINITASKSLWLGVAGLPDIIKGKTLQWQKRSPTCLLTRTHARTQAYTPTRHPAHALLAHRLKRDGPRGEALHLRGAARVHAQAAHLCRAHRRGRLARPHRLSSRPRARNAIGARDAVARPREPTSSLTVPPYPATSLRE